MRYYLGRYLYKKKGADDDYLPLDRIEDLFFGFKTMLSYLVEDLLHKGKANDAKGVCMRHDLFDTIRPSTREQLADIVYDPSKDEPVFDAFGPLTKTRECITLPEHVKVEWISSEADIPKLNQLLEEKFIGVDSEWRPSVAKFHKTAPSVFQISGATVAFLIDFVALKESENLDAKLIEVFRNVGSTIVGFSFKSDVEMFTKRFPKLKFFRYIASFIDA